MTLPDFGADYLPAVPRPVLAATEVRHQGDALVAVFAETPELAADAGALVDLDLEPLRGIGLPAGARVVGRQVRGFGDVQAAFNGAPVTVRGSMSAGRIAGGYLEPRSAAAHYDALAGELRLWTSTQAVFAVRDGLAPLVDLPKEKIRVVARDVGGSFGAKGGLFAEDVLVGLGAIRLGRPVRWTAGRSEDTETTFQGHGQLIDLEVAAEADGRIRGIRGVLRHDAGAYTIAGTAPDTIVAHLIGPYRLPALRIEVEFVQTNTTPTGFIRGGGRPVGTFAIERMLDWLADDLGLDRVAIRRRNLVTAAEIPYDTGYPSVGSTIVYEGGDFGASLERALAAASANAEADRPGVGTGVACYIESTGVGMAETARARIEPDGTARLFIGTTPSGQGHETMAAQILADRLGWPLDKITSVTAGDTVAAPAWSLTTGGSRSAIEVGNAVAAAGRAVRRRLLERASELLEVDPADLEVDPADLEVDPAGASVRGVPARSVRMADLVGGGIEADGTWDSSFRRAYSSGCHVARVEVDAETGAVRLLDYVIAHDSGLLVNPLTADGQLIGGWVHGVGMALYEDAHFEEGGEFRAATFLDYAIPTAGEVPIEPLLIDCGTRSPHNPEGLRGIGESGTLPVPSAIASAIEDALRRLGRDVRIASIPISAEVIALGGRA